MFNEIKQIYSCWHEHNHCYIATLKAYNLITNQNITIPNFWFKDNYKDVLNETEDMFYSIKEYIKPPFRIIYTKNNLYHAFIQLNETYCYDHGNCIFHIDDIKQFGELL